jgi:dTDP-4-amino-4,6-dideoxygalactose transaminase
MALYAILEALGIGPGDEVVIPAFTCVVVPNAILYRGATPVYVDIEPRTFNIDVGKVEAAITPRTRALYAQHTFGVPCDVEGLRDIARRHGLPIIEDAAHALGMMYRGQPAGSLTEVAFFSTDRSKVINTHLGGMATTNDPALAARLRAIQSRAPFLDPKMVRRLLQSFLAEVACFAPRALWLGRTVYGALARLKLLFTFDDELRTERPDDYPYPCRLSSAQAELGLTQLRDLDRNLTHRRAIARWLDERVGWARGGVPEMNDATWLRYSFLVDDRERFEALFRRRFDLGIWFTSVVEGRAEGLELVGYRAGSCPVAEHAAQHIVNFPTHPRIPLEAIRAEVERNWDRVREHVLYDAAS